MLFLDEQTGLQKFLSLMNDWNPVVETLGFGFAILTFIVTSRSSDKAMRDQTRRECVRATLTEFATIRRSHQDFENKMKGKSDQEKDEILKSYLSDLERFAAGCNDEAYAVDIVNKMSGGMLVNQYNMYFRSFIERRRRGAPLTANVPAWSRYIEYETMMKSLFRQRGIQWDDTGAWSKEMLILEKFLKMPISRTDEVFEAFEKLDSKACSVRDGKKGYLYIPGSRKDRCVIVAHADTYFDAEYCDGRIAEGSVVYEDGVFRSGSSEYSIGADDRAGCAMLWLLHDLGHSLLILDGEEHGQVGAHYLKEQNPALFEEINSQSFIMQLDRRGSHDMKFYQLPVTEKFISFIGKATGFQRAEGRGRTDICVLCEKICGVNLSVGYYNEHTSEETLVYQEWLHTYSTVRNMLEKPLKQFKLQQ